MKRKRSCDFGLTVPIGEGRKKDKWMADGKKGEKETIGGTAKRMVKREWRRAIAKSEEEGK